jgi:hypothetical protein
MPKPTISADGGAMPAEGQTSRRLFLAAGSAAAVFATVKSAAGSTGPVDPIFAAIAEHKALNEWTNERGIGDDEVARRSDIADEKMWAMLDMAPTSVAAAAALLGHVADCESDCLGEGMPVIIAIRAVAQALITLDGRA